MINIQTLEDIATLSETLGLECKLAAGRDGKGQLPADFWPTYSAFANSRGGIILLGVQEKLEERNGVGPRQLTKNIDNHCRKQVFFGAIMTFLRPKTQV